MSTQAATVMFSGQLADGLATPVAGILSDYSSGCPMWGLGRRTSWLFAGAMLVVLCYYMVFGTCVLRWFNPEPTQMALVAYYSVAAALFNVGWATVQVAHMALVPELSSDDGVRCTLNSSRYGFTILSNVTVFCVFFVLLRMVKPYEVPDVKKFSILADFILITGMSTLVVFLCGTKETQHGPIHPSGKTSRVHWYEWFSQRKFYQVGMVYMCTRLVINLTQVYLPFFLIVSLKMSATSIAVVPLVVYLAG